MDIKSIPLPEVYLESADFRFFINWFNEALQKVQYDTENIFDLYDPMRCPEDLVWALADTMGYKYDDRLPTSFNRLVLMYFMSMIYNRGSKDGVTLAAEVNLAQFKIYQQAQGYTDENGDYHEPRPELYNRLEDTSIPVNAVYVTPHTEDGYIDVVYFASEVPKDACIEYVRPLGMYMFQSSGVSFHSRTKISVDARLTDERDLGMSFGPTQVGHYRRDDYARMQRASMADNKMVNDEDDVRQPVWSRNKDHEVYPDENINPGYRALYSLQLANNEQIMKALISPIFSLGYHPQEGEESLSVDVSYPDDYDDTKPWNLRYDKNQDESNDWYTPRDVETLDPDRESTLTNPKPAVNPIMSNVGDAMSMNYLDSDKPNSVYTKQGEDGKITTYDVTTD